MKLPNLFLLFYTSLLNSPFIFISPLSRKALTEDLSKFLMVMHNISIALFMNYSCYIFTSEILLCCAFTQMLYANVVYYGINEM